MKLLLLRFSLLAAVTSLCLPARAADAPKAWPPDQFLPVTPARIEELPAAEQADWKAYVDASTALAAKLPKSTKPDFSPLKPLTAPLSGGKHAKGLNLHASPSWYAEPDAAAIADHVVEWQTGAGGWDKGNDYSKPRGNGPEEIDLWSNGTIDNDATTTELRFLARVNAANPSSPHSAAWRNAIEHGLHYLFAMQYPNGGYPQVYPLVGGYHDAITFNDDAMTLVLQFLREVAAGKPEYAFLPVEVRKEAAQRLSKGISCILKTQIRDEHGVRTAWAQQYDAFTLKPCAARNFEPIATTSAESAALVQFLMELPKPTPEIIAAVDDAVSWFRRTALHDLTFKRQGDDRVVLVTPGAPLLWSRLYEIGTDKPIFGDRDRTIHYVLAEISNERRRGYAWYVTRPADALAAYSTWHDAHHGS